VPARREGVTIGAAIGVSLLLHVAALTGLGIDLPLLQALPESPPIEARLVKIEPAPLPAPVERVRPPPKRAAPPEPPPPPVEAEPEPVEAPVPEDSAVAGVSADAATATEQPPAEAQPVPAAETAPPIPLNRLPDRIDLVYELRVGPATGEQTVRWVASDGRYTLNSVAAATGFARLVYSGLLVQTSQGRITESGLQPESFWDQRGSKHSSGRFDFDNRTLTVSRGGATTTLPLPEGVQDTQSLPFHFALTAPHVGTGVYHVFDGRKLRPYHFALRGEGTVDTPLGALRTLRMERVDGPADRRFEVWLAIDLHYLPVRVMRAEDSGKGGELVIKSIAYPR
jgi:hypothetical protein